MSFLLREMRLVNTYARAAAAVKQGLLAHLNNRYKIGVKRLCEYVTRLWQ
jgi:hypothetical protein